ncbi:MAG: primosomal protein N', partial [Cytophagaceae bacterium]
GIYHSKFSDNERVETWQGILNGRFSFVVGVRSSIFLPFDNLGLIIIDEEHEPSYKQQDPAPRYHARDAALVMARIHSAKTLLGSATPSYESYYQCMQNKRGLVTLNHRYGETPLPEIIFADTKRARKMKEMKNDFTPLVIQSLNECLANKEQSIVFRNRRGFAPYQTCEECAYVFKCTNCDVSLTYHMYSNTLKCHYCGYKEKPSQDCPACGSTRISTSGFGTEKIEQDLEIILPNARISRLDTDTTRKKNSLQEIIGDFENRRTDVLVGTQMVSKGFDFGNVSLVSIMDADQILNFPDFRSFERTFQMLIQVSGRAGRRDKKGKVIIQTANPQHRALQKVVNNDYVALYNEEISERELFLYPPFSRLIKITVRHKDKAVAEQASTELAHSLKPQLGAKRLLGPEWPVIDRIRNLYQKQLLIKLEKDKVNLGLAKELIRKEMDKLLSKSSYRDLYIIADVDPV